MGMTMTQKILAKHAGVDSVKPGDLITCNLDMVLANDITAPPAIAEFNKIGKPVFDKTKISLVPDHFTPNKDIKSAGLAKIVRDFARSTVLRIILKSAASASNTSSCRNRASSLPVC